jgi:hypothetical protein
VRNQKRLGLFERGNRSPATDRRKIDEEIVQGLSSFEVVQKSLKRNASLPEDRNPAKHVLVSNYDVVHLVAHFTFSLQPMTARKKGHLEAVFCNRK